MTSTTLVTTDILAAHLDDAWTIVDCRFDLQHEDAGRAQYRAGHIPGAIYAHLTEDLSGAKTGTNGRHPLPTPDQLVATFARFGIGPRTQIVVYDADIGMFAGRLWWLLRYMGHEAVAVLDGGFAKWVAEGRPVQTGEESRPAAPFSGTPRHEMIATVDEVQRASAQRDVRLVDARSPERFEGRSEPLDRAAGHIPGAVNHHFRDNAGPQGTMLPPDALRAQLQGVLGEYTPERTVMYCGSGVTACHNLLAMEIAGLTGARLYPGSWSEWAADEGRPVETGAARSRF